MYFQKDSSGPRIQQVRGAFGAPNLLDCSLELVFENINVCTGRCTQLLFSKTSWLQSKKDVRPVLDFLCSHFLQDSGYYFGPVGIPIPMTSREHPDSRNQALAEASREAFSHLETCLKKRLEAPREASRDASRDVSGDATGDAYGDASREASRAASRAPSILNRETPTKSWVSCLNICKNHVRCLEHRLSGSVPLCQW